MDQNLDEKKLDNIKYQILDMETENIVKKESNPAMVDKIREMIINRLKMFNFRQYIGQQSVEFSTDKDKNVTVLIGVNTSGKTTIVRAFEWCLYGKNGFEDTVLLNSEVRTNMKESDVQEVWVSVTFTHDDIVYTIKRSHKYVCVERYTENGRFVVTLGKKPDENVMLEYLMKDGQTKIPR